ncbi:MAG: hypothetical protein OXG35_04385 [Acidobacteria bacterium]|nr:hypothetical protein [Acidobacteriota bacterium]
MTGDGRTIPYPPSPEALTTVVQALDLIEFRVGPEVQRLELEAIEEATLHAERYGDDDIEDDAYTSAGHDLDLFRTVLAHVAAARSALAPEIEAGQ